MKKSSFFYYYPDKIKGKSYQKGKMLFEENFILSDKIFPANKSFLNKKFCFFHLP
jgi:hypothetical protein